MSDRFNVYFDESCHLQNDSIPVMVLGAVWCREDKAYEIGSRIRSIVSRHGMKRDFEIKWTKVSPAGERLYLDLVDYFFDDDDLQFRGVVIPDKSILNHGPFGQTHDDWYYKMSFRLLETIISPAQQYSIYLDIKDTRSEEKREKLQEVLRTANYDGAGHIVRRVQQIRSHESSLMQLADLLIGCVTYANRGLETSSAKLKLVDCVRHRSGLTLQKTTWLTAPKVNLLVWKPKESS